MNNENELAVSPIWKLLLRYSIPGIIAMLVMSLHAVVDRIFVAYIADIGELAISAIGVTMPVSRIILAFSMLIGFGATAGISIHMGRGDKKSAEAVLGNALSISLIVSVIIAVVGLCFTETLLTLFGASEAIMPYAKKYVTIILLGTIFSLTGFSMNSVGRADGSPAFTAIAMIVGCVINIILDPIFIFVLNMGIEGAAIGNIISQAATAFLMMYYFFGGKSNLKITVQTIRPKMKIICGIAILGASTFIMQIADSIIQAIMNNQLRLFGGDIAIGAYTVITSISLLFLSIVYGLSIGAQPVIGFNHGAGNLVRAHKAVRTAVLFSTIYLSVGWILIQCFPAALLKLFNVEGALLIMAADGMRINLFSFPIVAFCIIGANYFQYIGKAKTSIFLSLLRQFILLIPLLLFLPGIFSLTGIWVAQPISDAISLIVVFIIMHFEDKSRKLQLATT